jgi:hypothetical protein
MLITDLKSHQKHTLPKKAVEQEASHKTMTAWLID